MLKIFLTIILLSISFFQSLAQEYSKEEAEFLFQTIKDIKQYYFSKDIKDSDLTFGMIKGALEKIDPHSTYYTKEEFSKISEDLSGGFYGIGIYIGLNEGLLQAYGVIKDTPAEKAGLKNGDYITHINGKSTFGTTPDEAKTKLRGKKGTKVSIDIFRKNPEDSSEKNLQFEIIRDEINIQSVSFKKIENILIATISTFNEKTFEDLQKGIQKEQYSGIILDLRGNPGGILDSAVGISSLFLQKNDMIVRVSSVDQMKRQSEQECLGGKKSCRNITYSSIEKSIVFINNEDPFIPKHIPIVVLVNSYSASASEIVSLAIQENNRGIIIGQKTYGKGSVQSQIEFKDKERGVMKITTALYFSPKGNSIQGQGVTPDITIPEFEIKKQEKNKNFFPNKESNYKNYIKLQDSKNNTETDTIESIEFNKIEDFAIQTAITSIKTSIKNNGNHN